MTECLAFKTVYVCWGGGEPHPLAKFANSMAEVGVPAGEKPNYPGYPPHYQRAVVLTALSCIIPGLAGFCGPSAIETGDHVLTDRNVLYLPTYTRWPDISRCSPLDILLINDLFEDIWLRSGFMVALGNPYHTVVFRYMPPCEGNKLITVFREHYGEMSDAVVPSLIGAVTASLRTPDNRFASGYCFFDGVTMQPLRQYRKTLPVKLTCTR